MDDQAMSDSKASKRLRKSASLTAEPPGGAPGAPEARHAGGAGHWEAAASAASEDPGALMLCPAGSPATSVLLASAGLVNFLCSWGCQGPSCNLSPSGRCCKGEHSSRLDNSPMF